MLRSALFIAGLLTLCVLPNLRAQEKAKDQVKEESELDKLAKDLRHKDVKMRLKAAKSLGEKGEDAAPVARQLCDAIMDRSPQVGVAAMEALEKVRPDLYKHLSTLMLDKDQRKQLKAIQELGLLGEKAGPVVNILLARLRTELAARNAEPRYARGLSEFEKAYFIAVRQIKPEDAETIKLYKVMAGTSNLDGFARLEAIVFLTDWAAQDDARRKELMPLLKAGLDNPVCQLTCINTSGSLGALAKDFVPLLRKLKLSNDETVRQAAGTAIDKIENP